MGSIACAALGEDNGGIVLNISEGGLSLAVVGVLDVEPPQRIRVQPPRSRDWIELPGEFAWVSESRKAAGIRFHELTGESGSRIKKWIYAEASAAESPGEGTHDSTSEAPPAADQNDRMAVPSIFSPQISQQAAPVVPRALSDCAMAPSAVAAEVPAEASPLTWLKAKAPSSAVAALPQPARPAPLPKPAEVIHATPRLKGRGGWVVRERAVLDLRAVAAPIAAAVVLSFVGGWFAAREFAGSGTAQITEVTAAAASEPAKPAVPAAPNKDARRPSAGDKNAPQPAKQNASVPVRVAGAAASPKPPETAAVPEGTVAVNFADFPTMRVPPELKSESSRAGMKFQIGQLVSRVEPEYPEKIRARRMEGTVKLHAVIGRDGAVQSVALRRGPAPLAPLAMHAIREWQFEPTLLGGQAIETEEDITVVFRLTNPAAHSN